MPQFDKWLTNASSAAPVKRVARLAIGARLQAVVHYLQCIGDREKLAESIHQLRIWTRRSAAALRLFEPLVPYRDGKALRKRLRKLRRRAGDVRDCDVLLDRLQESESGQPRSIVKALKAQRRAARKKLAKLHNKLMRHRRLEADAEELVKQLAWPKRHSSGRRPSFGAWCRKQLVPLGERFFELAEGDLSVDASLHELRIAGKRLRYALELAPAALPQKRHQRLYQALTDLQDRLGTVCDHLSAVERLGQWRKDARSRSDRRALKRVLQHQDKQLTTDRRRFLRWWSDARRNRLRANWKAAIKH
jgi:CHAD domain-containing protein